MMKKTRHIFIYWVTLAFIACFPLLSRGQGGGDGQFTVVDGINVAITIDGSMGDWDPILADPDNNSYDGAYDGGVKFDSTATYDPWPDFDAYSYATSRSGRDAYLADSVNNWDPLQSTGRDLTRFAYTWDDTYIYAYTKRLASDSNTDKFIYYADADNDGVMEAGEPVIVALWKGSNRTVSVYIGSFKAGTASMTDANGYGDGWPINGDLIVPTGTSAAYDSGSYGSSDGVVMEWRVKWDDLFGDTLGPRPFSFHVSSTNSQPNSSNLVDQIDDNMAGTDGGGVAFPTAGLTFTPDLLLTGTPGTSVVGVHTLTNTGDSVDVYDITVDTITNVTPTTQLTVSFYIDTNSNGQLDIGTDTVLTDTDADGVVDSGTISPGNSKTILIVYTLPGISYLADPVTVKTVATSSIYGTVNDSVTDTIRLLPDLVVVKISTVISDSLNGTSNPLAIPGAIVEYTITVTNTGAGSADAGTIVVSDAIPANTSFVLHDYGSGNYADFTAGTSGLTGAGTTVYSHTDTPTVFTHTPSDPDGDGADPATAALKITPAGTMSGSTGAPHPSFTVKFRVKIE